MGPRRLRSALLVAVAALILAACGAASENGDDAGGPPVPDREFETFDGEVTSLPELGGQPMVVNFWASWCPPCIAEMPYLESVHVELADEVRFVGLNTQDNEAAAFEVVEITGVTYELGWDPDGDLFRDFGVVSMPSTFFVSADGKTVHRHAGILTEQQIRDLIDEHLVS